VHVLALIVLGSFDHFAFWPIALYQNYMMLVQSLCGVMVLKQAGMPGQGGGDRRPGHSRRDRDAGTNVTKLPGQTPCVNSRDIEWADRRAGTRTLESRGLTQDDSFRLR